MATWVTRLERPQGRKDKVKMPEGHPARSQAPRLIVGFYLFSQLRARGPQDFQSGMMSVPVTIRDDARDGASDEGRIVAGTAGFTVKDKGSQVLPHS